jgi:DNA replication and repair protein RecF
LQVGHILLEDFRNYERQEASLCDGLNLVVGRNAQGKTNLLEAVYCLSGLGSPRAPDAALVRQGAERALLHAQVTRGARTVSIDMELRPGRRSRTLINKNAISSARALSESMVSVFFGPDELSLVKGSPDGRRRFLDDLVVKLRPAQQTLRREWERVLKQRNAQLRTMKKNGIRVVDENLAVWDEAFCRAGARLGAARLRSLSALLPYATDRYREVAGAGSLGLAYESTWLPQKVSDAAMRGESPNEEELAGSLAKRIEELRMGELERGASLAGPGRDDVIVRLENQQGVLLEARTYASQGDQRTAALALKLGEHDLLKTELDDPPVLLLDDVFSELDPKRRGWLRDAVESAGQTLLSSAETETWAEVGAGRVFEVTAGRIEQRG